MVRIPLIVAAVFVALYLFYAYHKNRVLKRLERKEKREEIHHRRQQLLDPAIRATRTAKSTVTNETPQS